MSIKDDAQRAHKNLLGETESYLKTHKYSEDDI